MWKVVILGTLASILFAGCQPSEPPTATIAADTPQPAATATATSTAVPTPTSTPVPTATPSPVPTLTPTRAGIATTECDDDFVGLGGPVGGAIDRTNGLEIELLYQHTISPNDLAARKLIGGEFAEVWNLVATDSGEMPKRILSRTADSWQKLADIPIGDSEALSAGYSPIVAAYEELAVEFEKCDAMNEVASRLRDEARLYRQLADAIGKGP